MPYKTVILIRHGYDERLMEGQGEACFGLGPIGQVQIQASANWLQSKQLGRIKLLTSDRKRAKDSAEILGAVLAVQPQVCQAISECLDCKIETFRSMMNTLDTDDDIDTVILVTHTPDHMAFKSHWQRLWKALWEHSFNNGSCVLLHPNGEVESFHPPK